MSETILYGLDLGVARITLNRPEKLNSFNRPMAKRLREALDDAAQRVEVRSVLITGSGRAFCAGQDLSEAVSDEGDDPTDLGQIVEDSYNPVIRAIVGLEKPVVCAVNGVAAGAGANLALACDLVLASKKAKFIQSFCNIGLIPDSGGTYHLPRLVGMARAKAMMLLGEPVEAEQAEQWGLISATAEHHELEDKALEVARHLAKQPTRGLGLIKRALNRTLDHTLDEQLELEKQLQSKAGFTKDYQEGVRAFMEKRKPVFKGE
ncbi:MAG TPA: 2-(1,2-epoxy-1,2-dihydrophenyl)acetyl-CoA isomerase PaaG [Acidobacteriota bacterium]|nr:2-(1,2-epoxy-1,2-dihydrophenyl)acetyl-CoA isomerase PaaG [Acidobacteriota bacterium]